MLRSAINVRVRRGSFPLELANRDWGCKVCTSLRERVRRSRKVLHKTLAHQEYRKLKEERRNISGVSKDVSCPPAPPRFRRAGWRQAFREHTDTRSLCLVVVLIRQGAIN